MQQCSVSAWDLTTSGDDVHAMRSSNANIRLFRVCPGWVAAFAFRGQCRCRPLQNPRQGKFCPSCMPPVLVTEALPVGQLRLPELSCHGLRPCTWGRQEPTGQAEWGMLTARRVNSPHSHCPACTDLVSWMLCLLPRRGSLVPSRRSSGELRLRCMWAGMLPSKGLAAPLSPPAWPTGVTCWRPGAQPSHAGAPRTKGDLPLYLRPSFVLPRRL